MLSSILRAFDETVRAGSIRKASEILGVAPSSVSRHIATLEREMGTVLFERRAGGVELTYSGKLVAEYARSMVVDYDSLRTDLSDLRGMQRRLIRLTMVESVAASGPIGAVVNFRKRFPTVTFSLRVLPAPAVVDAVKRDFCDIGLGFCVDPDPDLIQLAHLPEPIVLLVHADHPLAAAKEVHVRDLVGYDLALPHDEFGIRQIFDRAAAYEGLRLPATITSNTFETLREFADSGAGVAVLPERAVPIRSSQHDVVAIPLVGNTFRESHVDLIVLRRRRLPRVVKAFVDALIETLSPAA